MSAVVFFDNPEVGRNVVDSTVISSVLTSVDSVEDGDVVLVVVVRAMLDPSRVEVSMVEPSDVVKAFSVLGSLVDELSIA